MKDPEPLNMDQLLPVQKDVSTKPACLFVDRNGRLYRMDIMEGLINDVGDQTFRIENNRSEYAQ